MKTTKKLAQEIVVNIAEGLGGMNSSDVLLFVKEVERKLIVWLKERNETDFKLATKYLSKYNKKPREKQ